MKTLEDYIAYYGELFGPIRFNEAHPSLEFCIECEGYQVILRHTTNKKRKENERDIYSYKSYLKGL